MGGSSSTYNIDQEWKTKKAYEDFVKEGKAAPADNGKLLVSTAAAYFKADDAVKRCEERRERHVRDTQERHSKAVLHFHILTEELGALV